MARDDHAALDALPDLVPDLATRGPDWRPLRLMLVGALAALC